LAAGEGASSECACAWYAFAILEVGNLPQSSRGAGPASFRKGYIQVSGWIFEFTGSLEGVRAAGDALLGCSSSLFAELWSPLVEQFGIADASAANIRRSAPIEGHICRWAMAQWMDNLRCRHYHSKLSRSRSLGNVQGSWPTSLPHHVHRSSSHTDPGINIACLLSSRSSLSGSSVFYNTSS